MKYTDRLVSQFLSLYHSGQSHGYIAKELGIKKNQVVYLYNTYVAGKMEGRCFHLKKSGERHNVSKLSDDDIMKIFSCDSNGLSAKEIAEKFKVHVTTVRAIFRGESRTDNTKINELRELRKIRLSG